jgi:hypothetical protein
MPATSEMHRFTVMRSGNATHCHSGNTAQRMPGRESYLKWMTALDSLDFDRSTSPGNLRMFNPFAQGGWTNAANPNAGSSGNNIPQPSLFGALPYPTRNAAPNFMSFRFTSFSPTIMDSTVTGSNSRTYFRVKTDVPTVGFTVIHNSANQPTIIIEWLKHPVIEIRDALSKRQTSQWLALSADQRCVVASFTSCNIPIRVFSYRKMTAVGKTFVWVPDGKYICVRLTPTSGHSTLLT